MQLVPAELCGVCPLQFSSLNQLGLEIRLTQVEEGQLKAAGGTQGNESPAQQLPELPSSSLGTLDTEAARHT